MRPLLAGSHKRLGRVAGRDSTQGPQPGGVQVEATKLDTEQATTSGTALDFSTPFATVTRAIVIFQAVGTSGSDDLLIRIGPSSGVVSTSYVSQSGQMDSSAGSGGDEVVSSASTTGFIIRETSGAFTGKLELILADATNDDWVSVHNGSELTQNDPISGSGMRAALGGALAAIRLTRSGADTFSTGAVNVRWYGY